MGNRVVKPSSIDYTPLISGRVDTENENLRVFNLSELKKATNKFKHGKVVICEDNSVQTFYKGYFDETTFIPSRTGTGMAVSVMEWLHNSSKDLQEWKEQVKSLGQISHPNLVKNFGYCYEDNKSLLVYEYSHKGSLDSHIFGKEEVLPWEIRVKIAIGTAQALVFLQSIKNMSLYQTIRMHNIMLDEQYNAKLFFLGSINPSLVDQCIETQTMMRFPLYMSPEYVRTGRLTTKSDVYTFGVILVELLACLKFYGKDTRKQGVFWTNPFMGDANKIREIIDPRLGNNYPVNAATQMGKLITICIDSDWRKRPLMQQVLDSLNEIAEMKD